MNTVQLIIKGKVQGVFFRASAKKMAEELGLAGWIKNTHNGGVEAVVSGKKESIENFIAWCKIGPKKASVVSVQVSEIEEKIFENFAILK
ncbi:MAG: acylphosphatase [Ginsengibacter sp.]